LTDIETASSLVHDRVTQEWYLKESIERRAQFLAGAAATASALAVAAVSLLSRDNHVIPRHFRTLVLASAICHVAVGVLALIVLVPLGLKTAAIEGLKAMVQTAASQPDSPKSTAAFAARADAEVKFLASLEHQNMFKVALLFVATLGQAGGIVVLGWAVIEAVNKF
jgi:hypothetical protein